jgi:Kef-type K+ transport system membrane component KefB
MMAPELVFLAQGLVILVLPIALWRVLRLRHAVPLVCIQILVGIALGPSLFGRIAPELHGMLFNPATLTPFSGIAAIAVLLFGYITGLHFRPTTHVGRGRDFAVIATASVAVPTAAGFLGGLWIAGELPAEIGLGIGRYGFATAIGICIGVTALPVLSAILGEMNLLGERIGDLALGVAAVNDAALWLLLGGLMTVLAGKSAGTAGLVTSILGTPIYLAAMIFVLRPLLVRLTPKLLTAGRMSERGLAAVCAVAIGSAMATQALGLHYIFGAFVAGSVMPNEMRQLILDRLQLFTLGILMPFFFTLTGLRTSVDLGSFNFFVMLLMTTGLAILGKVGGTAVAARLTGESWSDALGLGALVQTKGLMELVVLTVLLDQRVISTSAFSALTLMAVITTLLAMPLARFSFGVRDRRMATARAALRPDNAPSPSGIGGDESARPAADRVPAGALWKGAQL